MRLKKIALEIADEEGETNVRRQSELACQQLRSFCQHADASRRGARVRSDDQIVKLTAAVITAVITGRNNAYRGMP